MARRIKAIKLKNGFWGLDYTCCLGKRHRETVSKNSRVARELEYKRAKENFGGTCEICMAREKRQSLLFMDVASDYLSWEASRGKKSLARDYYSAKALTRYFGNKGLSEITVNDIEKYKMERLKTRKGATVNRELACLRRIFNICINYWELSGVEKNPVRKVRFEKERERFTYLLPDEVAEVERIAYERHKIKGLLLILAIRLGLRRSDLFQLKWDQLEFITNPDNGEVNISVHIPGIKTKSGDNFNTWIVDRKIVEEIKDLYSRRINGYVFTNRRGRPFKDIRTFLRSVLREAGILNGNMQDRLKDFCWHSLRHTFASNLVMKGIDLNTVMTLGGWKNLKMVLRYSHLSPGHLRTALASFNRPED
ncbi:MAG: tyrosine-type recombinase/integrase [Deltaproteobacteria bacterium]|nr:MAG: tyrosine-type recombinase/integrase [Deltaproteobacteria bacterium]